MSLEQKYEIEPELRFGIPRPAKLKLQARRDLQVLILLAVVVAWVIAWFSARDLDGLYALRDHGVVGEATITDKREAKSKSTTYYLSYSLQKPNIAIEDEDEVSESLYDRKNIGDVLNVTYLPERSQIHRVGYVRYERVRDHTLLWLLGFVGGSGFFGLCALGTAYGQQKELRLV